MHGDRHGRDLVDLLIRQQDRGQRGGALPRSGLGERLTRLPGSSAWFLGGAITYSNELKTLFALVPPSLIVDHGAVSEPVAAALAEGIAKQTGSSIGVGITGIAGPSGGTPAKPVGLVWFASALSGELRSEERRFAPTDRDAIRAVAARTALFLGWKRLRERAAD